MSGDSVGFFARLFGKRGAATRTETRSEVAGAATNENGAAHRTAPPVAPAGASNAVAGEAASGGPGEAVEQAPPQAGVEASDETLAETPANSGEQPEVSGDPVTGNNPADTKAPVVTVVALEPHAGLATLCAALEHRFEDAGVQVRAAGSGLMRAAFAGMLDGADVLLLLAPADSEATAGFKERLQWLEANGRPELIERTVFVVNYGSAKVEEALEFPADLSRPVVLLPFDAALSLPARQLWAPRRAARHALNQLVDEITKILG